MVENKKTAKKVVKKTAKKVVKKTAKKVVKKTAKKGSKKKINSEPLDSGIVIVDDDLSVDKESELEERRAYLEEARSQEASSD